MILRGQYNLFCDVFKIGDVENPSVSVQKYFGCGETGALVPLLEWVGPNYRHHQSHSECGNILDLIVVEKLARARRSAPQFMRFKDSEWLPATFDYTEIQAFKIIGGKPLRLIYQGAP